LRELTSTDSATFGGYLTKRCTWSGSKFDSTSVLSKWTHTSRQLSRKTSKTLAEMTLRRYFGMKTK